MTAPVLHHALLKGVISVCLYLMGIGNAGTEFTDKPNIVFIVADDLGWNDVSFRGRNGMATPNIDKLASEGIILNNYYVLPICTPSRSAIMTGRYPIFTGMQTGTIFAPNTWGVGLEEKLLPEYMKELGYKTHMIGKWHLGFFSEEYTPLKRGFDTFYGSYLGKGDYWSHQNFETFDGLDLVNMTEPDFGKSGVYNTELLTTVAEQRIRDHDTTSPLFLYVAYLAPHSANTRDDPIQAPNEWVDIFDGIKHLSRRKYAGVVAYLDYGIGRVYEALRRKGILDNTIIVFTTDNGGPANGFNMNWANNYPLRGVKSTLWEGGVRGTAFIHSAKLKRPGRVSTDLMHCTDWLPTLLAAAGGEIKDGRLIQGRNAWHVLQGQARSSRHEILLNIDMKEYEHAALRFRDWKIIDGQDPGVSGWYEQPEDPNSNVESTGINASSRVPSFLVDCGPRPKDVPSCSSRDKPCLFHISSDPCEYYDLSSKEPSMYAYLLARLSRYKAIMVPPRQNETVDPASDPALHGYAWKPWVQGLSRNVSTGKRNLEIIAKHRLPRKHRMKNKVGYRSTYKTSKISSLTRKTELRSGNLQSRFSM